MQCPLRSTGATGVYRAVKVDHIVVAYAVELARARCQRSMSATVKSFLGRGGAVQYYFGYLSQCSALFGYAVLGALTIAARQLRRCQRQTDAPLAED